MKLAIATLVALYIGSSNGVADPSEAAQAFLRVEESQWASSTLKEEHFKRSDFPKGLWEVVEGYFTPNGIKRDEFVGYSRGGADNYYKFRMEFRRTAYHEVWAANFSDGKVIEKKIEQVVTHQPVISFSILIRCNYSGS